MTTNTYTRPLYTVPKVPPNTKGRFAALLRLREQGYKAFDKAVSLPRSAIRWAVSMFQKWVDAAASAGVFSWLGQQARNGVGVIRAAGVIPVAVAVLSIPPIAAAATRLARFVGNGLRRVASAAWAGLKGLLARCGTTGARITQALTHAGSKVASWVRAAAEHPIMVHVVQTLRATVALVRPISQGFVAHRLLGALVPILWLRTVIGLLVMPMLIDTALADGVRDLASTPPAGPTTPSSASRDNGSDGNAPTGNGTHDATDTGLPIDAFGPATEVPMPTNGSLPTDEAIAEEDPPLNRAARRAQQRQDAQARRTRPRR